MTDAERDLVIYMARILVARADPGGLVRGKMQGLLDSVMAEQPTIDPQQGHHEP